MSLPGSRASTPAPPLAAGLPLVGSLWALTRDAQGFFFAQYLELGSIFRVRAVGREFKVLAGPEINVRMATEPDLFSAWETWEPIVRDFGGRKTLTMLDGPEHARLRGLMRRSFSRTALIDHLPQVVELVQASLRRQPLDTPIPVVRFMQRLTADILGLVSNGRLPGERFDDIVYWWNTVIRVHLAHQQSERILRRPKYRRARDRVKEFARTIFEERQTNRPAGDDDNFLDNLADASARDPQFLGHDDALMLTIAAYFAGLDTVANASSFMLYELLRRPDLLERARAEADRAFAGGPTAEALRNLPVLHAAAMEILRLYPIAGVLPRTATRDFTFDGYPLRKGEGFLVATCATHFAPQFFPRPNEFDIERFAEPRHEHKARGVYAPFGAGPHTCLGAGLAEVQILLMMAATLHGVELALHPTAYKLKTAYTPSLSPRGLSVRFTARRS